MNPERAQPRIAAARDSRLSVDQALTTFAKQAKSKVRERLIRHENAPTSLLEQLKHDPVKRVRDRATRKLRARGYQ